MNNNRGEKIKDLIKHCVSEYAIREAGNTSLITITDIAISEDGKNATVLFTALPESKQEAALGFLKRHRGEMREYIKNKVKTNAIPYLDVKIDLGEKNRQRIDQLLRDN
ncbi:MAG: ribosome-binding factor A [bacterium]